MKKFYLKTFGCKVNQYDSALLSKYLLQSNWTISKETCDYYLINTCAVTQVALSKQISFIKKIIKERPEIKVIVFGCLVKTYPINIKGLYLIHLGSIKKLATKLSGNKIKTKASLVNSDKARYFLKVADGCDQYCSYCIIPYARGKIVSRSVNELVQELLIAERKGFREVVLTGIHLGKYGQDLQGINLNLLLIKLLNASKKVRFRLSSIEINELDNDLIDLIKKERRICRHLHISLQSGSSKILKLMKRPYTKQYFKKRINYLKKLVPDIVLTTDVIVGFPGETKIDFQETYKLVQEINFLKIHVFPFSKHEITKAANLKNQLSDKIKKKRSLVLRTLSERLFLNNTKKIIRSLTEFSLIIEQKNKEYYLGRSQYYFPLKCKFKQENYNFKVGDLVLVQKKDLEIY
jgi:threonylcarbamoyladenosine tRNA methylthiotransferase MtaB